MLAPASGGWRSLPRTKSFLCCWPMAGLHLLRPASHEEGTFCRVGSDTATGRGCPPPARACVCFAGSHFNGSNLRMCRCHFYEVGVKKIYSLFQKAFFKKKKKKIQGKKSRITSRVYGLPHHALFAPLHSVISSLCLFTGGQSFAGQEPVSPS